MQENALHEINTFLGCLTGSGLVVSSIATDNIIKQIIFATLGAVTIGTIARNVDSIIPKRYRPIFSLSLGMSSLYYILDVSKK
jgi:hypothetical protein